MFVGALSGSDTLCKMYSSSPSPSPQILYGAKPPSQTDASDPKDQGTEGGGEDGGGVPEEQGQMEEGEEVKEEGGTTVSGEELEVIDLEDEEYVPPAEEGGDEHCT